MIKQIFIRPSEVAIILGVSKSTIYRWFWEGKLKGIKLSDKNIRILTNSVDKLLSECW
jgi:excisionase family DNA binding protein